MANKRNKKGKSSPKGRARPTRKSGTKPQVTRVPGSQFSADGERVTLKYTQEALLTQGASGGTLSNTSFKLNSVYQVDAAGGTPQGVAELSAKFKKVHVFGSTIRWQIRNMQGGGTYGSLGVKGAAPTNSALYAAVLYPLPSDGMASTSIAAASVQKYAAKRFDWPRERPVIAGAYEPTQINPRETWSGTHKMTIQKLDANPVPQQDSYVSGFTSDPTHLAYWIFSFQDLLADAAAEGVWLLECDVWYDVYAFERIVVGDAFVRGPLREVRMTAPEEKKMPPPKSLESTEIDDVDVSPHSLSIPGGYELVKRKPLVALGARR